MRFISTDTGMRRADAGGSTVVFLRNHLRNILFFVVAIIIKK